MTYQMPETPVAPPVDMSKPSYAPTILISYFFGLFGLIPAIRHSKMARERGYTDGKYWVAFGVSIAAGFITWLTVSILGTLLIISSANNQVTTASAAIDAQAPSSTSDPSGGGSQFKPYATTPQTTVLAIVAIRDQAFLTGDISLLSMFYHDPNYFAAKGDVQEINGEINTNNRLTSVSHPKVNMTDLERTKMVAEVATDNATPKAAGHFVTRYTFEAFNGRWYCTDLLPI